MGSKIKWLLVGDGSSACCYAIHAIPLRLTQVPLGAMIATRKTTAGPSHNADTIHTAHVGKHHGDHQRREDVFVEYVTSQIEIAAHDKQFDEIIVVLPPKALAHFRKVASADLKMRVKQEISADWTHLSIPDLIGHLAAALP